MEQKNQEESEEETVLEKHIAITVKSPERDEKLLVGESGTIFDLKKVISAKFQIDVEQIRLIFTGRILKDHDTLASQRITDGVTVHMVVKPQVAVAPLNNDLNQNESVFSNPELRSTMLNSPLAQSWLSNPEIIRALILNNPQMQQMMENNPMVGQMLNNDETLQQIMELVRNPSILQEMMRSNDQAMRNIESIPGGFSALENMYRNVQEPMLNAVDEQFSGNPFTAFSEMSNDQSSNQQGTENNEPLPNPWSTQQPPSSSSQTNLGGDSLFSTMLRNLQKRRDETPETKNESSTKYTVVDLMSKMEALGALLDLRNNLESSQNNELQNTNTEQIYEEQMNQLTSMGFTNRDLNLRILSEVLGDINAAIELLLSGSTDMYSNFVKK